MVDPESKAMWDELRAFTPPPGVKWASPCCQAIRESIAEGLKSCTIYDKTGKVLYHIALNFCPGCGRPLR